MSGIIPETIDARYQRSFGVRAGYLPDDRNVLNDWHEQLMRDLPADLTMPPSSKAVQELAKLIDSDSIIRMYVREMIDQAAHVLHQEERRDTVKNVPELLAALDKIVVAEPIFNGVVFPMSALFAYMMMTRAGEAVFRDKLFNEKLLAILKEWCDFLNSEDSRDTLTRGRWLSLQADIDLRLTEDYVTADDKEQPYWNFGSWNAFFHRRIKSERRPVSSPDDPNVIVSANDGKIYKIANQVKRDDIFWAKGQPYSLRDMLNGSQYVEQFIGGTVIQSFLSGSDCHWFATPITGTVREVQTVPGLMFSNAESAGFDPDAGVLSQGYDAAVNTRGLVFIESPLNSIGMVCVVIVGITEISSITFVDDLRPDKVVSKGDELGYFSFGGSTLCLVFQPNVIDDTKLPAPESMIKMKDQIAVVR